MVRTQTKYSLFLHAFLRCGSGTISFNTVYTTLYPLRTVRTAFPFWGQAPPIPSSVPSKRGGAVLKGFKVIHAHPTNFHYDLADNGDTVNTPPSDIKYLRKRSPLDICKGSILVGCAPPKTLLVVHRLGKSSRGMCAILTFLVLRCLETCIQL